MVSGEQLAGPHEPIGPLQQTILDLLRIGNTRKTAFDLAGVVPDTFQRWIDEIPAFRAAATTIWYYLTAVDPYGVESFPSAVLSVFPGSAGDSNSDYYVGDLAVGFVSRSGPNVQGAYTYAFYATWTSPDTATGRGASAIVHPCRHARSAQRLRWPEPLSLSDRRGALVGAEPYSAR